MKSPSLTHLITLVSLGQARSISLPPLIPHIPSVTEALNNIVPPVSYPAATSSPRRSATCGLGAGGKQHKGFLAAHSLGDDTFGTLIYVTDVPGGLLSLLKTQVRPGLFHPQQPVNPKQGHCLLLRHVEPVPSKFLKSNRAILSSIADEVRTKLDGGFYITYMGSALGTSPGRLVETDAHFNIIHKWPEDVDGLLNILGEQFSPHGLSIGWERKLILTSDFVEPISILKPSLGIRGIDTLCLWYLGSKKILNTITIPEGDGIQDTIYPERKDRNGKPGVAELLYGLGPKARDAVAIYTDISQDGRFLYLTLTTANHIAALDISDLNNMTPDQRHLVVTDYFVQTGEISLINTPADLKALYIDFNGDGSLSFNRSIDFSREFANRGGSKPHSTVVFDLN
ncbi:hypothetical protein BDW71DRAFT_198705 [Aspergillus fruticulosus]